MPYYAQIDGGKVAAVTQTSGVIDAPGMVPLETFAAHLVGYSYADGVFSPPAPALPAAVTMRQARLALLAAGKLSLVQPAIDALPEPDKTAAQITWEYSTEVQRDNGLVSQLAPVLGLDAAALDALFAAAAAL